MVCSPPIGLEIVRGSITRDRWNVTLRLSHGEDIPLGQRSHLFLKVDWQSNEGPQTVDLTFSPQAAAGGGRVVFNDANGSNSRRFSGDGEQLVAIYGTSQSPPNVQDVTLEVKIDDEVRHRIPLSVRPALPPVPAATAMERLQQEMAIALRPARPSDAAPQRIWDRYTQLFDDARAIADHLPTLSLPAAPVPTLQGTVVPRAWEGLAELADHLRSHRHPTGMANAKAQQRTDVFDPFRGHWRGDWRQTNDCGYPVNTCQDHLWGATAALPDHPEVYVQWVELGEDSRPYTDATPARSCTAIRELGRDRTVQAINAIHLQTGVILGAVGVRSTADPDGLWAVRPHVGFYLNSGDLLWLAEEHRSRDGNTITYSLFRERREATADSQPLYTILAVEGTWNRTRQTFTLNPNPKAGQYLQIGSEEERQLEQQFRDRHLELGHLQDAYYRRQLEALPSTALQPFEGNAPATGLIRDYLNRLRLFIEQQEALRDAPAGDRERITFILGEVSPNGQNPDPFYIAANHYFTVNPAGTLVTSLRSLVAVRNYLDNHPPSNGRPWGEVNLVVHANEEGGMGVPVVPDGRNATPDYLEQAIDAGTFLPLSDGLMDVRSTLRIRGCALGQSQRMLEMLSRALGGNEVRRPIVRAPIHLQRYRSLRQGTQLTQTEENPTEFWFVGWPGAAGDRPSRPTLVDAFTAKYPDADVDWDRALQNRVPNIEQEIRDRPFPYLFRYRYFPNNPPDLGHSDASRLAWLRSVSDIDDDLRRDGHRVEDYRWRVTIDQNETLPDGRRRFRAIAHGQRTILRLQRDLRGRVLLQFRLDGALQSALMTRTLSQALREGFAAHQMPLSDQAEVSILEVNRRWLIQDSVHLRTFLLVLETNQLHVNLEQDFVTTEPVVNAHPAVTDLRHFGEEVPARSPRHPLGENVLP